tara:strand:+ start:101 stop:316 length:216 start_codon:yes stop_codon:yes gene_type:complete
MLPSKELKSLKISYRAAFSSQEGERVLADLQSAYYRRGSFSKDAHETSYREGQRSVVIRILNLIMEDKKNV